ncbi:hypothetical protein AVDCRST_MAG92-3315 [uncultured Coleofasciculus sp.]|uniref:Uncharacterized protein n=1 Tax=uncultured Coleofasciculus sp. TaxID=1267456 RepID=A0A6J4JID7_9CYAN|nr:hypothetical protein AVDCRST_MAG92-3315 [uncultured Coleofasciculus sp.]
MTPLPLYPYPNSSNVTQAKAALRHFLALLSSNASSRAKAKP